MASPALLCLFVMTRGKSPDGLRDDADVNITNSFSNHIICDQHSSWYNSSTIKYHRYNHHCCSTAEQPNLPDKHRNGRLYKGISKVRPQLSQVEHLSSICV
ncbi:hypothetical protein COOONC_22782 [Cooperia oncophora]